jgi:flagellar biosynthesis/type III secretory pathway protein FliH
MYDKLLGMLKPDVPDVDRCNLLVEKLVDFIEEDRELECAKARDEGLEEGYDEGKAQGRDEGFDSGHEKGHSEGYDSGYDSGYEDGLDS